MRSASAAAAVLLVAACAELGFLRPAGDLEFDLAGRFAVQYRDEAASGSVAWRHAADGDEMLLSSPFGQGLARLVRTREMVTLTTSEGRDASAADAEELTERLLGFRIPLGGLADWVRGRPAAAPPPALVRRDAAGRLAELEQSGWRVEYLEYAAALPARLKLSYPGLELRLAISEWK
ncbi:MAG: lipoprotein insertase outer membrane protein LolB [Pseudomonadota bacterium]